MHSGRVSSSRLSSPAIRIETSGGYLGPGLEYYEKNEKKGTSFSKIDGNGKKVIPVMDFESQWARERIASRDLED